MRPVLTRDGTYRTTTAEDTRARIEPRLAEFGITRVADITGLDDVGLPVHVAYRPCGTTLAVSIGIGTTHAQSWVSAAMESIEVWHAENVDVPVVVRAAARDLDLPYDVRELRPGPESLLSDRTVVDWVRGRGLLSGEPVLVPRGVVELDSTRRDGWDHMLFGATSNGTATGNTLDEAVMHGLLEVIERDACAAVLSTPLDDRAHVDPASATHPTARRVYAAVRAAGCWVELCRATNAVGIPAYSCALWSPDLPLYFTGFGCHPDAGLAVARAISEAALSRLATVSGARDDIDEDFYLNATAVEPPARTGRVLADVEPSVGPLAHGIADIVRFCALRVRAVTGQEPIAVDLTHADVGIAATKLVAPGLRMFDDRLMSSRAAASAAPAAAT